MTYEVFDRLCIGTSLPIVLRVPSYCEPLNSEDVPTLWTKESIWSGSWRRWVMVLLVIQGRWTSVMVLIEFISWKVLKRISL